MTINRKADEVLDVVYADTADEPQDSDYFARSSTLFDALSLVRLFLPDTVNVADAIFVALYRDCRSRIEGGRC